MSPKGLQSGVDTATRGRLRLCAPMATTRAVTSRHVGSVARQPLSNAAHAAERSWGTKSLAPQKATHVSAATVPLQTRRLFPQPHKGTGSMGTGLGRSWVFLGLARRGSPEGRDLYTHHFKRALETFPLLVTKTLSDRV